MSLADVTCDGCSAEGRAGGFCRDCPARAFGTARGLPNCAYCEDFETCGTLQSLVGEIPGAKENQSAIKAVL